MGFGVEYDTLRYKRTSYKIEVKELPSSSQGGSSIECVAAIILCVGREVSKLSA